MHATRLSWAKASVHHSTGLSQPAVTATLISHYGVTVLGPFKHVACDVLPVTALCLGDFSKWALALPHWQRGTFASQHHGETAAPSG